MSQVRDALTVLSVNAPATTYASVAPTRRKKGKSATEEESDHEDQERQTTPVHVCIKSKTWDMVLGSLGGTIDFRQASLKATLLFECSGETVERKTVQPLEFDAIPSKNGRSINIELRVHMLSSQMEGALFCVSFAVRGPDDTVFELVSDPIRVVSKKSQLEAPSTKKRSRTTQVATREAVLELIEKMEGQMAQSSSAQQQLLAANAKQARQIEALLSRVETSRSVFASSNTRERSMNVEDAFNALLDALGRDVNGPQQLAAIGKSLDASQWSQLAPLFAQVVAAPPMEGPFELTSERSLLGNSLGALFGLGM